MQLSLFAAAIAAAALTADAKHVRRGGKRYNTAGQIVRGAINVHLVPHSHDDVGWLKTVDQYAVGGNNSIQHANTGLTIDTVVESLLDDPSRTFSYVEQAFFQRWWEEASDDQQDAARQLVASGQLSFLNGGWCMHDESSPTYVDMLDQTFLGHRNIAAEFGASALPKMTWQIDPFGHSATQASLLSSPLAGYEGLFFWRIDYQDRAQRTNATNLEFIWRSSANLGSAAQTFTDVMPSYGPPDGRLCWDEVACAQSEPIIDDELNTEYNVPFFVNLTVGIAKSWAPSYKADSDGTVHLLWPMGSDFQYTNARGWYKNLDKLIHYVNANTSAHGVNLLYSTPTTYGEAKLAQNTVWPKKTDDFFPYADGPHAMWSGYFTSRPALKGYVRDTSCVFQASKQLQFAAAPPQDMGPSNPLYRLERAMGVTQHHDSVSGTSKQHVAYDYARRLAWGREDAQKANQAALSVLTGFAGAFETCDLHNATICPALENPTAGTPVLVLIYNQQAQTATSHGVRLPVGMSGVASYAVAGPNGAAVPAQLIPASAADTSLRVDYYKAPATAVSWLAFQAPSVPAMGYAAFFVTPTASAAEAPETHVSVPRRMQVRARGGLLGATKRAGKDGLLIGDQTLTNGVLSLTISAQTGMVSSYANAATGLSTPLAQSFGWYNSSIGDDAPNDGTSDEHQPSGAYIFRPNSSTVFPVTAAVATVDIVTGPIVNEAQQVVADGWITQVVRLWAGQPYADFEWTVGPIPNGPSPQGKEVIVRYATPFATHGGWATDSNCREMIPRQRDARSSFNYTVYESVAGNYVPVNCRITASDASTGNTLSVTTDRTQGGASMVDGSVELMVHRRLQHDDYRGVGEPLNEPGLDFNGTGLVIRGVHRVSVDPRSSAAANGKRAVQNLMFKPLLTYSPLAAGTTPASWIGSYKPTFTGLAAPLPANVHLVTAHAQSPSTVLVRLAHLFEQGEDAQLSLPATVSLANLFNTATLSNCVEMTTVGSKPLASIPVRTVQIQGEGASTYPTLPAPPAGNGVTITLAPMAVRTFMCDY